MSDLAVGHPAGPLTAAPHPLSRLRADEIRATRSLLTGAGVLRPQVRVTYLGLEEPPKVDVLQHRGGDAVDRRVRAILLDASTGAASIVVASLTRAQVDDHRTVDPAVDGQPSIMLEDLLLVDEIVKGDEGWRAAMLRRGITNLDLVRPCPLAAGSWGLSGEDGRRMLRVLSFLQHRPSDHPWAHPIDGVVAYIDLVERRVVRLLDDELLPIPEEEGNFDDPAFVGPVRDTLRPIEITQPDGPSWTVSGDEVSWEGWRFRVGFDAREGLVLHQISLQDRPIIYRASIAEMFVPYGDPNPVRFWQSFFDCGEYSLGLQANSLSLGCDCLGLIHYFDVDVATEDCEPRTVSNAICMHEEDFGVLWKHTDIFTESAETRRQRRLVISNFVTVGNYDYGFFWYLYLDGTIELEVKATGVLFTSSYKQDSPWATEVAPGLGAPYHQHLFSARLDMTVDGTTNAVDEVELERVPVGPGNAYGNAFRRKATRLTHETAAARFADASVGRVWQVLNPERTNRFGQPVGYQLRPQQQPLLAADESSAIARRAAFATRHLWVTAYDPRERYSAGELPNQHAGGGLPTYVQNDRPIDGADIVLWHTFGTTHFPRPEDWPVMPVARCGFTLEPVGFFDRNPTLDVPASTSSSCHDETHHGHPAHD
jgi:primary-amine oxidase